MREFSPLSQQLYRFHVYLFQKPKIRLEHGMFIVSIDVDVGSKELGILNNGKNDANVSSNFSEYLIGKAEEQALHLFIDLFNDFGMPATFAIRGQLIEVSHSMIDNLLNSSVKHDVGAHGYSHHKFSSLSRDEAENELKMISEGFRKVSIIPKSFIFPRNRVAHLGLLAKYGYKCYRGFSPGTDVEKEGQLYNVHPSLFVDYRRNPMLLRRFIDLSIAKKAPFHIWFHMWNFGLDEESVRKNINRLLLPTLKYAKQKVANGTLSFETMLSAAEKVERFYNIQLQTGCQ